MQKENTYWYIIIIITFIIWGTQHPMLKILSNNIDPILFNFLRFSIACLAILPFVSKRNLKIDKKDLTKISFIGFFGIFIFGITNIIGVRLSTSTNNAILLNSWPLLLIFIAPILIKEKITKKAILGTLLGFIGVTIIITNGKGLGELADKELFTGNLLIMISALMIALYSTSSKKYIEKYDALGVTFYAIATSSILLLITSIYNQSIFEITQINLNSFLLILWISIPTTALTYVVWFESIKRIGLVKTSSFFFLIPVSGILASSIILDEQITAYTIAGAALILAGVYIVQRK